MDAKVETFSFVSSMESVTRKMFHAVKSCQLNFDMYKLTRTYRCQTELSTVHEPTFNNSLCGLCEVGIMDINNRVLATHLQCPGVNFSASMRMTSFPTASLPVKRM